MLCGVRRCERRRFRCRGKNRNSECARQQCRARKETSDRIRKRRIHHYYLAVYTAMFVRALRRVFAVDVARMRHQSGSAHRGRAASVNQLTVPLDRLGHNPTAHARDARLGFLRFTFIASFSVMGTCMGPCTRFDSERSHWRGADACRPPGEIMEKAGYPSAG